ncbi:MAG: hypothetical protein JWP73_2301 [Phenylobacterium sp.]|nr:hypothetical protein [Phenylobacterium sp.]
MDSDAEMMERHGRLLARFAEQTASLAGDLQACALAAETPEQKQALSLAFHRMGRALRQTLALEAKLRRDARREDRLETDRADEITARRVAARKARVRGAVEALIWDEVEDDEQLDVFQRLDERLESEDLADPDEPVEALIQRIAKEIGLSLALPIHGEGGPSAERSEERMVEGASQAHGSPPAPSTTRSSASGPPPPKSGEAEDDDDDDYWRSTA